jgi:Uma2 family endonuclease
MPTATVTPPNRALAAPLGSDVLYEIVNGELREVPPMGILAVLFASFLNQSLGNFGFQRKLGVTVVEGLFRISQHLSRRPDVAFVTNDRLATSPPLAGDPNAWEIVPNLAVEVVSPTNMSEEMEDRILEYFAAGVELVWIVYPRQRRVYVYESPTRLRILTERDELEGGTIIPGYRESIASLFGQFPQPK